MTKSCFVGIALVALLGVACDTTPERSTTAPAEAPGAATPPSASADATLTDADRAFVQKAAQSNRLEVEMAKMGQDKAQNEQIKDFARQLDEDHSDVLDELQTMARRANLELDPQDDAARASMTDKMGNVTGRQFDSQWLSEMIDKHRQGIATFEQQQTTATGELKSFIDKTLPVMRAHLQRAEELQKQLGNTTNP
jgi:putative membrane protein